MKKRLRKGNYATLNVYFQYSLGGSFGVSLQILNSNFPLLTFTSIVTTQPESQAAPITSTSMAV